MPDGPVVNLEDGPIFQELMAEWIQVLSETGRNDKPNENGVFEVVSRPGIEPGSTV